MKRYTGAIAAAIILAAAVAAQAQTTGVITAQGFSVGALIRQLSLYLPEESTQGMLGGFGGRGGPQGAQARSGGTQGTQGQGAQAGRGFAQLSFTRDPKLFLTKDQITKLLPLFVSLKDNPLPTPSKAKQVQAGVDGILTAAQKAEYVQFEKEMQKLIETFRQQMGANGGAQGSAGNGQAAQASGAQGQGRTGQAGAGQLSPLQRAQRQVEAFTKVLQERLAQLSA